MDEGGGVDAAIGVGAWVVAALGGVAGELFVGDDGEVLAHLAEGCAHRLAAFGVG